jgi:hypothetical protein
MSAAGRSRVYGWEGYKHGHVLASVTVSNHRQARLLQRALEREMRDCAGQPEEAVFAEFYNSLARTREQARRERWIGWEEPI